MASHRDNVIIVGSGPAGLSCALALLKQGVQVKVLDIGVTEPEHLSKTYKNRIDWDYAYQPIVNPTETPLKPKFGSFHAYHQIDKTNQTDCLLISSQSVGGLSSVWGRACLPYTDRELIGWPLRYEDLMPYYQLIEQQLMSLHCANPSASAFPYHAATFKALPIPKYIDVINNKLQQYFEVVSARIALNKSREHLCTGCGHCLVGCPEDVLLEFSSTINQLSKAYPNLTYVPNIKVNTFSEAYEQVTIQGMRDDNTPVSLSADKLFLACGPLASAMIVLESQEEKQEVDILDSQYFIIPYFSLKPLISAEELLNYHSSCQVMVEHLDGASAPHRTHLQFYFYNEIFERTIYHKLPFLKPFRRLLMPLFRHLGVVQGFMHSDLSSRMKLRKTNNGEFDLSVCQKASKTMKILRPILWKLCKAGLIPLLPAVQIKLPGQSFHNGGSFPMQASGGFLTTEPNGKLRGFERTYIADSSAFPSIPATTITYSIMANAYRIGDIYA